MSISFLTPTAALVSLVAVVPVAAALRGGALAARVRSTLGLPPPSQGAVLGYVALALTVVLLGLAAAQPVLIRTSPDRVRADAQVLFVVDVSQSMAASSKPGSATRLARARDVARRIRASIPEVEAGVATLTDRVLPDLLPVPASPSFDATLERSVQIEEPPPLVTAVRATSFAAIADVVRGNYFAPDASKRIVVFLTDGETSPYDEAKVARALEQRGIDFEAVRVGDMDEAIYDAEGKVDAAYVPDRDPGRALAALASATGGRFFSEGDADSAAAHLRKTLGSGPIRATGLQHEEETLLASLIAALALLPFAVLVFCRDGVGTPLVRAARRFV